MKEEMQAFRADIKDHLKTLATKEDINALKADMKEEMQGLREDMKDLREGLLQFQV
jgi:hypothetical protein